MSHENPDARTPTGQNPTGRKRTSRNPTGGTPAGQDPGPAGPGREPSTRPPVVPAAAVVGVAFLLVGVAGFVPGITTGVGDMAGAGHHSGALLLGVFQVSVLHNLLHLGLGALGVLAARRAGAAKAYLLLGGVLYLALWVYGLAVPEDSSANVVPLNAADDWLHLGLGLGMLLLGLVLPRRASRGTAVPVAGPSAGGDIQ